MPKFDVQIRRSRLTDAESLCDTINCVAREKWSLATADGFTPEQTRSFLKFVADHSLSQVVAVASGLIVGWCDIVPKGRRRARHGCPARMAPSRCRTAPAR